MRVCGFDGCEKAIEARGWCTTHYMRWVRHGDPSVVKPHGGGPKRQFTQCSVAGCDAPYPYFKGYCRRHHERWKKYGDPLGAYTKKVSPPCLVPDCGRPAKCRGWCTMHYSRWLKHRDVGPTEPLMRLSGDGHITADGYHKKSGRAVHRVVMEQMLGRPLMKHENVHHKNGDRLDNRPENLELWVKKQPPGQRLEDVLRFYLTHYRSEIEALLNAS